MARRVEQTQLTVYLPRDMARRVCARAQSAGLSASSHLRALLELDLARSASGAGEADLNLILAELRTFAARIPSLHPRGGSIDSVELGGTILSENSDESREDIDIAVGRIAGRVGRTQLPKRSQSQSDDCRLADRWAEGRTADQAARDADSGAGKPTKGASAGASQRGLFDP